MVLDKNEAVGGVAQRLLEQLIHSKDINKIKDLTKARCRYTQGYFFNLELYIRVVGRFLLIGIFVIMLIS